MLNFPKPRRKFRATNILTLFSIYNRRLTYRKLPEKNLKLSVLKLDGSSFSFQVERNATVGKLKLAIEEEFSLFPKEEREQLWSLVWSNFCLCYEGQMLIRDTVPIQKYGIKDGDQLHFIQHLSIDLPPTPQQSKNLNMESRQCSVTKGGDARKKHRVTHEDHQHTELLSFHSGEDSSFFPERRSRITRSLMGLLKFQHSERNESFLIL
ncbi:hypothetical protein ACS0TY_034230 [Phlomoides rotata]